MAFTREALESQLNDPRADVRREALLALAEMAARGEIEIPAPQPVVNLHCHTSFSYNGYGWSPSYIAWKARVEGLLAVGVVDFDVLDAVDEFLSASAVVGIRACAGIESRVFVPRYAGKEINSPGEPGIAYHMGTGYVPGVSGDTALLARLKSIAQQRNRTMLDRINAVLDPVLIDYERDVASLTPNGNATERHLCIAYDLKARRLYPDDASRVQFWASKLDTDPRKVSGVLNRPPELQGLIRSRLMKSGGAGYVQPSGPEFPTLEQFNAFVLEAGALPTLAWLDGTSEAERDIEKLLDSMMEGGVAAVNIIPDRNWNIADPKLRQIKVEKLHEFVACAKKYDLPVVIGTEINAYGQRFVDDFEAPELQPLIETFLDGAYVLYGHTVLQARARMGYLSRWARKNLMAGKERNAFYRRIGECVVPGEADAIDSLKPEMGPQDVLRICCKS
jgi:hypothetical protein